MSEYQREGRGLTGIIVSEVKTRMVERTRLPFSTGYTKQNQISALASGHVSVRKERATPPNGGVDLCVSCFLTSMGPPRRSRSNSSLALRNVPSQRQISASSPPPSLGMSPASRYVSNMNVIRRRDSSIVSIFDQFSHVCVYHHNGDKWEKQGYEGSMFLYERYILPSPFLSPSHTPPATRIHHMDSIL